MIELLNNTQEIESNFYRVFRNAKPLSNISHKKFPIRVLVSTEKNENCTLNEGELSALNKANNYLYKKPYFLTNMIWGRDLKNYNNSNKRINSEDVLLNHVCSDLISIEIPKRYLFLDHAYISSVAKWGIILSTDNFGILVCEKPFWDIYENESGYPQQVYYDFLRYFGEEGLDRKWVIDFMSQFTNVPQDPEFHTQLNKLANQQVKERKK